MESGQIEKAPSPNFSLFDRKSQQIGVFTHKSHKHLHAVCFKEYFTERVGGTNALMRARMQIKAINSL